MKSQCYWSISPPGKPKTFHSLKVRGPVQCSLNFNFLLWRLCMIKETNDLFYSYKMHAQFFDNFHLFQWSWLYQSIHNVHHTKPQHGYSPLSSRKIWQERLCVGAGRSCFLHKLSTHQNHFTVSNMQDTRRQQRKLLSARIAAWGEKSLGLVHDNGYNGSRVTLRRSLSYFPEETRRQYTTT